MPETRLVSTTQLLASLFSLLVTLLIIGGLEFWSAGTLDWPDGRLWLVIFTVTIFIALLYLWRVNPEIFVARSGIARGTKAWDYIFIGLIFASFVAVFVVAGLDFRFGWTHVPDWLLWIGYLAFFLGFFIQTRAQAENRHFEPGVRIQSDRGHQVIDTGLYGTVRHPGYISGSLLILGTALGLGSFWSLIPALVCVATLMLRTIEEERTLRAELPGYADYTQRTKYRWIPGIW